jgi:dTDP-4-dehydrorhamnose reductase
MGEKTDIGVVADQYGSPTYARDLALALIAIIESGKEAYGTYHYTNAGQTNWYNFAQAIHAQARRIGLLSRDCSIRPLTTDQYPTKARRPAYSVLSKAKIERVFGIVPPEWEESLGKYMMEISGK